MPVTEEKACRLPWTSCESILVKLYSYIFNVIHSPISIVVTKTAPAGVTDWFPRACYLCFLPSWHPALLKSLWLLLSFAQQTTSTNWQNSPLQVGQAVSVYSKWRLHYLHQWRSVLLKGIFVFKERMTKAGDCHHLLWPHKPFDQTLPGFWGKRWWKAGNTPAHFNMVQCARPARVINNISGHLIIHSSGIRMG